MLRSSRRKSVKNPIKRRPRFAPRIEALEHRLAPVVNAPASFPATIGAGAGYDGVVQVFDGIGGGCSGTLLSTSRHILTAAHCVDNNTNGGVSPGPLTVQFDMVGRIIQLSVPAANITIHGEWDGTPNTGSDIAIMRLNELAPFTAEKRSIYRDTQEKDQNITFIGYGGTNRTNQTLNGDCPGPVGTLCSGNAGSTTDPPPYNPPAGLPILKRQGFNKVDSVLTQPPNSSNPFDDYVRFDLDNPSGPNDSGIAGESISAPGDSGGPLLISGLVAGVASTGNQPTCYGCVSNYTRVSSFADWIDDTVAGKYDLVIDMQNQLPGDNVGADTITIVTGNIPIFGERLFVSVNGVAVYDDFLGAVKSITILGSGDVETFKIDPNKVPIKVPMTIDTRGGLDEIKFAPTQGNLDMIQSNVQVDGGTLLGADWLTFNDGSNASKKRVYTITDNTVYLPNKFRVTYQRFGRVWLTAGTATDATVNVESTIGGEDSTTNVWGAAIVNVGKIPLFCNSNCGKTTEDIRGELIIFNPFQKTALTVDNSGGGTPKTVNITDSEIGGLTENPIQYGFCLTSSVTVKGGSGGNTFLVHSTGPANLRGPFYLYTGTGVDQTYVYNIQTDVTVNGQNSQDPSGQNKKDQVHIGLNDSLATIQGMVTVTNPANWSAVTLYDSADTTGDTVTMSNSGQWTYIVGLAPSWIRLRQKDLSALDVRAGSGGNVFNINDTPLSTIPGGATTKINAGSGTDTVNILGTKGPLSVDAETGINLIKIGSPASGLDKINAVVNVSGPGGTNTLSLKDSPSITTHNYTVTNSVIQRTDKAAISYQDVASLSLTAGTAYDQIIVQDTAQPTTTTLFTNGGNDYIAVARTTGLLNLYPDAQSWIDVGNNLSSLDNIQGRITIYPFANNQMTLRMIDTATNAPRDFWVSGTASGQTYQRAVGGSGEYHTLVEVLSVPVDYFEYFGGSGGTRVFVDSTSTGTTTRIIGHAGVLDTFHPGWAADMNKILGPIAFHGQAADNDFAYYYDYLNPNPQTYAVMTISDIFPTMMSVQRPGTGLVSFDGLAQVIFYTPLVGGNTVSVQGVPTPTILNMGVGDADHVTLGNTPFGNTLAGIKGPVSIGAYGNAEDVNLIVDNSDNTDLTPRTAELFTSAGTHLVGLAPANIYWDLGPGSSVSILGGEAPETFALKNTDFVWPISIDGGGGVNTLDYAGYNPAMPGLVSWWKGEGSAQDSVGSRHGTPVGDTTFVAGKVGQAFSFDGDGDYVQVSNWDTLEPTTVSVEAWVNSTTLTEFGEYNYILSKGAKGYSGASYALVTSINSGLWFYVGNGSAFGYSPDPGSGIWDGNWHHVVGTYDGSFIRLYVDGAEVGNGSPWNILGYGLPDSNDLYIGTYGGIAGYSFDGLIDEPSVFNRALSAEEVQKMFAAGAAGKSVLATGVTVNLRNSTASGLAGGIKKIQNVIGSASHDILVGNGGNVLTGGAGRDLLIAGALASQLFGGDGEDILIGGTTEHDQNEANLNTIMSIWTSDAEYETRVATLKAGWLGSDSVSSNGQPNTLYGQGGRDFFFLSALDLNDKQFDEEFVPL